ncbi:unnamed protein product [Amoebophrya sp. A120]|nr:unnamed protein product [Amoebophrya sp. A120]|eukprot:GSA120T00021984001.1
MVMADKYPAVEDENHQAVATTSLAGDARGDLDGKAEASIGSCTVFGSSWTGVDAEQQHQHFATAAKAEQESPRTHGESCTFPPQSAFSAPDLFETLSLSAKYVMSRQLRNLIRDAKKLPQTTTSAGNTSNASSTSSSKENKASYFKKKHKLLQAHYDDLQQKQVQAEAKIKILHEEVEKLRLEKDKSEQRKTLLENLNENLNKDYKIAFESHEAVIKEEQEKRQALSEEVNAKLAAVKKCMFEQAEQKKIKFQETDRLRERFRIACEAYNAEQPVAPKARKAKAEGTSQDGKGKAEEASGAGKRKLDDNDVDAEATRVEDIVEQQGEARDNTTSSSAAQEAATSSPRIAAKIVGGKPIDEVPVTHEEEKEGIDVDGEQGRKSCSADEGAHDPDQEPKLQPPPEPSPEEARILDIQTRMAEATTRLKQTKIRVLQEEKRSIELDQLKAALIEQETEYSTRTKSFQETAAKSKQTLQKYKREVATLRRDCQQAETATRKLKGSGVIGSDVDEYNKLVLQVEGLEKQLALTKRPPGVLEAEKDGGTLGGACSGGDGETSVADGGRSNATGAATASDMVLDRENIVGHNSNYASTSAQGATRSAGEKAERSGIKALQTISPGTCTSGGSSPSHEKDDRRTES